MMGRGSSESANSLNSLGAGYTGHHGWGDRGHWNGVGVTSRGIEKHQGVTATAPIQPTSIQNASAATSNEGRARCGATRPPTSPLVGSSSGPLPSSQPIMINPSNNVVTIEDQIRTVDKVIKECEHSRKSLEVICRRLDDLNDEVKRYRDFLGHEKSRRDPTLYKTNNVDRPSIHNDSICGTMGSLTAQLTQEWTEKLRGIHNAISAPQPSTPSSRASDRC